MSNFNFDGVKLLPLLLIPYFVGIAFYRLYLDGLRKYPGPRWASVTNLHGVLRSWTLQAHVHTHNDHIKYGSAVRLGPDRVAFNTIGAIHDIYNGSNITKIVAYNIGRATPEGSSIFSTIDKRVHRIKRQRLLPLLNERSMRTLEPTMVGKIDIFLQNIAKTASQQPEQAVNISQRCQWLGMDIVGQLGFGYELDLQSSTENRFIIEGLKNIGIRLNTKIAWTLLGYLKIERIAMAWDRLVGTSIMDIIGTMIKARMSQEKDAQYDLFGHLTKSLEGEDERIRHMEIWNEALFFLPAGGDTTGTLMCTVFYFLAKHPERKAKLLQEIEATFADGKAIKAGAEIGSCKYLRACLDEALRMAPPVPGVLWREQVDPSTGPLVIDGHVLSPRTKVGVSAFAIHHNPEYFPDPFSYMPERWLDETAGLANRAAWVPFSVGSRACGGKAMAYQEASLTIAKSIYYFDWDFAPGHAADFKQLDVFTSSHDGPFLKFTEREGRWQEIM